MLFKVFQGLKDPSAGHEAVKHNIDSTILMLVQTALKPDNDAKSLQGIFRTLGILTEVDEVTSSTSLTDLEGVWERMRVRDKSLSSAQ